MYLGWFDDDGKKPVSQKISEGAAAYRSRFKEMPEVCLVSQADFDAAQAVRIDDVKLVAQSYMLKNNFHFGQEAQS